MSKKSWLIGLSAAVAASALFVSTPASAATTADDPYSVMDVTVKGPKTVKAGKTYKYTIDAYNEGPHVADYYYLGGTLPKGTDLKKLRYSGPKGTQCAMADSRNILCWGPWVLEKGDADWLTLHIQLKKGTKGTATAKLGAIVYDIPTGMTDLPKDEIDRLGGFNSWFYGKTVKSKIVR
ncbi:hypothetical protein ACIBH1_25645 [Nonomuraea sp. NPDC050663]|uniref:hypothetical protein n=1 Tax=Nonomuraea sp. NPDC050663 TaxID=3364370 RepID=UPI0037897CF3